MANYSATTTNIMVRCTDNCVNESLCYKYHGALHLHQNKPLKIIQVRSTAILVAEIIDRIIKVQRTIIFVARAVDEN